MDGEVASYGGFTVGEIGSHPAVGASTGALASRYAPLLVDAAYTPKGADILAGPNGQAIQQSRLYTLHFEGHVLIPLAPH